ncbi:Alcohol dehydrogenase [Symmachiella dynata]|uniref:zinc-dependent alcohol dehydrogenase family protein n=1 Tax=Symmachiella dynata TaxID=2527995 RepID=UPI001189EDF2|nr:zinc-dependent alcohol dehydrogenase family protein [Symmachiella dynata]QDT50137.1 Alcohol dehydrogenase [Symmachiella dynata]
MQAVVLNQFGEPADVLRIESRDQPVPASGHVRVRMLASPINPSDLMMIRGQYGILPELPATPGFEGVGIVEASGGGLLGKFLVGKRVAVLNGTTGNWQQQTTVPAKQAVPLGKELSVEQAAMFFVNPATAYVMTRQVLKVPRGAWLLQTAAGSALGKMVIRLGRKYGFRTLNVVRREEQVAELKSLGGDAVIAASPAELPAAVAEITSGQGVPYAIDPVGGPLGTAVVQSLGKGGRMLVFGTLSGEPLSFSPRDIMTPDANIAGFWLSNHMNLLNLIGKLKLVKMVKTLLRDGTLTADVGETFPLDKVCDAVQAAEQSGRAGKVLLSISE